MQCWLCYQRSRRPAAPLLSRGFVFKRAACTKRPPLPDPHQGLSPETRTFNVVMAACNAAGKYAQTLAVFAALAASGRAPSTASLHSAITAHCR